MKEKDFIVLAKQYFGEVLEPFGFNCEKSNKCTFYKTLEKICLIIKPVLSKMELGLIFMFMLHRL